MSRHDNNPNRPRGGSQHDQYSQQGRQQGDHPGREGPNRDFAQSGSGDWRRDPNARGDDRNDRPSPWESRGDQGRQGPFGQPDQGWQDSRYNQGPSRAGGYDDNRFSRGDDGQQERYGGPYGQYGQYGLRDRDDRSDRSQGDRPGRSGNDRDYSGAGYAGPGGYGGGYGSGAGEQQQRHMDPDYAQWRREQMNALDDDYNQWRQDRFKKFSEEFSTWRSSRTQQSASNDSGGSTPNKQNKDPNK